MPQVAVVTGTSTGLGISIAIQLAQHSFTVYATMRNPAKQDALLAAANKAGVTVQVKAMDVTDSDNVNQCISEIIEETGKIDVLVNNAGAGFVKTTEHASEEEIQWVLDVNFMGVVRCTKAVLPNMRAERSGHVINISSVGGLVGQPFNEIYCAAKFAVEGYTESLACYLTPSWGINFTSVEPGGISSDFAKNVLEQLQGTGGTPEDDYQPIFNRYITRAGERAASNPGSDIYQSCDAVAQVVIDCIDNPNPPVRTRTSDWSNAFCQLKTQADPDGTKLQQTIASTLL